MYKVNINKEEKSFSSKDAVIEFSKKFLRGEMWLSNDQTELCILKNTTRIYVMLLTESSSSTLFDNKVNTETEYMEEFTLSNGQVDEFNRKDTLPVSNMQNVITSYLENKLLNDFNYESNEID
ncbi:hypothetical protein V9L05_03000 [Bernardetia sp. Wsw4-3y2]|uniref:hypothetical protein n=1 Tax=Bernardetia sp. Wsw4-3y2 TaxID=3127471 RepID=UPI0030CE3AE3